MTELIGVAGFVVLFVLFGALNRGRVKGCGSCHEHDCDGCELAQGVRRLK